MVYSSGLPPRWLPPVTDARPVPRAVCLACVRPQSACICRWVSPVDCATEVLILQHPLEVSHAKNSARLLHLSLANSQMLTGESFDESTLRTAMQEPKYTVLLYPHTAQYPAPEPDTVALQSPSNLRLIVLDGTWRKSRKMLHCSPLLQELPRLTLREVPASNYRIRKAHKPGQLSTLEATCAALIQLEGQPDRFAGLLDGFNGLVAHLCSAGARS